MFIKRISLLFIAAFIMGSGLWAQNARDKGLTGWDYFKLKEYSKALVLLSKDHKHYPHSYKVIDGVGWCYFYLGDLNAAEVAFKNALKIKSDYNFSQMGLESIQKARMTPVLEAEAMLDRGEYAVAARAFYLLLTEKSERPEPLMARAHQGRGTALFYLGRYAEALKEFQKALNINKNDAQSNAGMGHVNYARQRYKQAEEFFTKALKVAPNDWNVRLNQAWCSFYRKNIPTAIKRFTEIIKKSEDCWEAYLGLGWCFDTKGEEEKTVDFFRSAMRISSDAANSELFDWIRKKDTRHQLLLYYGFALIEKGEFQAALDLFLTSNLNADRDLLMLGAALGHLNLGANIMAYKQAKALLDKRQNPEWSLKVQDVNNPVEIKVSASSVMGWAMLRLGCFKEAENLFKKTRDADAFTGLGYLYLKQGKYKESEMMFKTAGNQLPEYNPAVLGLQEVKAWQYADYQRAWVLMNADEIDWAVKILRDIPKEKVNRFPKDRLDLIDYSLGHAGRLKGDLQMAETMFKSALEKNPDLIDAKAGLGWVQLEKGELRQAIKNLEAVVEKNTDDPAPRRLLAKALIKSKREDMALEKLNAWVSDFDKDVEMAAMLGELELSLGHNVESCIAYHTVVSLDPDWIPKETFDSMLEKHKEFIPLLGILGWSLISVGKNEEALARFMQAHKKEPGEATHLKGIALAACLVGELDTAEDYAEKYLSALGETPHEKEECRSTCMKLGSVFYDAGQYQKALNFYQSVEKADGVNNGKKADVQTALGWTWLKLKKHSRAKNCFLDVILKDPRYENAIKGLETLIELL